MNWWIVALIVAVALVVYLWPVTPRTLGRLAKRLVGYAGVLSKAKHNRFDVYGWMIRRPALLATSNAGEFAQIAMNGVDARVKVLAGVKTSSLAGCPF